MWPLELPPTLAYSASGAANPREGVCRAAVTESYGTGQLKQQTFSTVLESESPSKIKVSTDWVADEEGPLPDSQATSSHCVVTWWERQGSSLEPLL